MNIDTLCDDLSNMQMEDDEQYFGGIYAIWKGNNPIYINYFIYEDYEVNTEYKADSKLWKMHEEDFEKNRFSELNQEIKNISDIEIQIVDCHLFKEDEKYNDILNMLKNELHIYQLSYLKDNKNVIKKRKDTYNMTELLVSLEHCLEMDELFGEE